MTADLDAAVRAFRKAEAALKLRRAELRAAIIAEHEAGAIQADLARATGFSRETIARITSPPAAA